LVISTNQSCRDSIHEAEPQDYSSNALRLFIKGLEETRAGQILDVGPVCSENINFLARQVKRLYLCDMYIRLDRVKREDLPLRKVWPYLDYPSESFDGILLWDLVDRLDDREVGRLKAHCRRMLRKNGMVVTIALSKQENKQAVNSFVIGDDYRLSLRRQLHLHLSLHIRQNREVLELLSPFSTVKSFIYRNGIREFLCRLK
jgi:hypothetical protein